MRLRLGLLTLLSTVALAAAAPAATAPKPGAYEGRIDHQGYDITFRIKGTTITDIVATMLQDCDRNGVSESFVIAPDASWTIRNGRFSGRKVQTYGQARAHVTFRGTVRGGVVKGFIREWDTVEGSGIVCDTRKRTFTARRA